MPVSIIHEPSEKPPGSGVTFLKFALVAKDTQGRLRHDTADVVGRWPDQ
jgi:hypothetical protein